jgi:hypothetical protein
MRRQQLGFRSRASPVPAGAVAYSSGTQTLLACVAGQWTVVPLPQGPQGDAGPQGPQGVPGIQGDAGTPGSLLKLSDAGDSCPNGGERIDVGRDKNGNGALDDGEIEQTAYICNGKDGANGSAGAGGQSGGAGGGGDMGGSGGMGGQLDAGIDGPDPLECVRKDLETAFAAAGTVDQSIPPRAPANSRSAVQAATPATRAARSSLTSRSTPATTRAW